MAEFTAHFLYIRVYFSLISSDFLCKKSSRISPKSLVQSNLLLCFFCCFVKNLEIKKVFGEVVSDNFSNSWLKNLHASGLYKIFPPFFLFGAEYFLLELSGSMQLALARPHYDTLCRVQAPPESRTKNLASKNEGARPKLSWRLLSLSDLRLSQINANFT